jgi:hypothetical protein
MTAEALREREMAAAAAQTKHSRAVLHTTADVSPSGRSVSSEWGYYCALQVAHLEKLPLGLPSIFAGGCGESSLSLSPCVPRIPPRHHHPYTWMIGAMAIRWLFLVLPTPPSLPALGFCGEESLERFSKDGRGGEGKAWVTSAALLLSVFGSWQLAVARRCPSIDFRFFWCEDCTAAGDGSSIAG